MNSQRGLSGTWRRTRRIPRPRIAPAAEREPPAEVGREDRGVQQQQRREAAERRPDPEAAVDREVDPAAVARGDQLVDRRVDRGVLAADAHAGEEAAHEEVPGVERERGRHRGDQVERERDHEELLAPVAVGELAEEQRAEAGARRRRARRRSRCRRCVEVDAASGLGQARRDRADDRHLEPVEDPDGPEADDDPPVEARPRQPVEPGRNVRLDDALLRSRGHARREVGLRPRNQAARVDARAVSASLNRSHGALLTRAGLPAGARSPDDIKGAAAWPNSRTAT